MSRSLVGKPSVRKFRMASWSSFMDVEGVKFVNGRTRRLVAEASDLVLDRGRRRHENVRGVLALGEDAVKEMFQLEPAHLMDRGQLDRLGKSQVLLPFRAGV